MGIVNALLGIAPKVLLTLLAVDAVRVMLTTVAHTPARLALVSEDSLVEVALGRVVIALAPLALVGLAGSGGHPRSIVIQGQAPLAVDTVRVVLTHTLAVHHACGVRVVASVLDRHALVGVAIAQAAASHHHLVQSVVVLLADLVSRVEQIVAERVQLGEVNTQVGDSEQVLDTLRVRVACLDERGRQDLEHDLALGGRRVRRVLGLAVDVLQILGQVGGDVGKGLGAVGGEVAVRLPRAAKVRGLLDDHGRRPERLERHDDVGEGEGRLEVEAQLHTLHAVLGLPPAVEAIRLLARHNILHHVALVVDYWVVGLARIAHKALGRVGGGAQDAVALGIVYAACGARGEELGAADEEIARGRVAVAKIAASRHATRRPVCLVVCLRRLVNSLLIGALGQHRRHDQQCDHLMIPDRSHFLILYSNFVV